METERITSSPQDYGQWLNCFEILKLRSIDHDEYIMLCGGGCRSSASSIEYIEKMLVSTVNAMINRSIKTFKREFNMYVAFGEVENIHIPYIHFAQKIKLCMFFRGLEFMSMEFRSELEESVRTEVKRFWKSAYSALYNQCVESTNPFLEDELYLIRGIKIF